MTDTTVEHRRRHTAEPGDVRVDDDEDGFFRIRMPLASSDEARDGRALERSIIEGWRDQIAAEPLPLFLDHGHSGVAEHRYGALGKVGYWEEPEIVERDSAVDLEAERDGGPTRVYTSEPARANAEVAGQTVEVVPTADGFDLEVTAGDGVVGTARVPEIGESTTVGDLSFRTVEERDAVSVVAEADDVRLQIAEQETYG